MRTHLVNLIEAFKNLVDILCWDAFACISNIYDQSVPFRSVADGDMSVVGSVFKSIGDKIKHHPLHLLHIYRHGSRHFADCLDRQLDVALARQGSERLYPILYQRLYISLLKIQSKFTVLILSEIKYLVDQTAEYAYVLVGYLHQCMLLCGEIRRVSHLFHRLGNECQWSAQVM